MESRRRHRASSDDFEAPVQPKYPQVPLAMLKDALSTCNATRGSLTILFHLGLFVCCVFAATYTSHMPYDPEKEVDSQARAELLFK